MAMNYLEEQKKKQQEQQGGGYNLQGVSAATQQQLQKQQQGYQPTQAETQAQQNIQTLQSQKPQTYNSKYGAQLESILQQINNPQGFKYEFNGDEQFKYLADLYTQNAKKANINAQAQAAALTGGYGNSYGAAAGAQAYQEAILPLYEQAAALRQQALVQYNADRADKYNQLGALQSAENTDYGRYQDEMANWRQDVADARNAYTDERNFGYNAYADALKNAMTIGQMENADFLAQQDENFRQAQLAEQIRGTDLDEEYRRDTLGENIRQANMDEQYRRDTLAENIRQADLDEAYRQQAFGEQVRQADLDEQYRRDSLAQNQQQFEATTALDWASLAEKQREYDSGLSEEQRQYNQKMAQTYALAILENGQIPSNELLVAAGLSYEDAQKLVAQIQTSGGPGGKKTPPDDKKAVKNTLSSWNTQGIQNTENMLGYTDPDIPPQTSNMDTPVTVRREGDDYMVVNGITKPVTQASYDMSAIAYNNMIRQLFDEELKMRKD